MKRSSRYLIGLACSAAAILALALGGTLPAHSQQAAPKQSKGFKTAKSQIVELGPEIEGLQGRQLRLRLLTIEPGGPIAIHDHKNRPAVVYFLQGVDTVIFGDGTEKQFKAGDTSSATKDTTHWHRNDGKEQVQLIAVDIFQPKKK
jgi:quercetin dioxygenase-like cupin family protein